ncbi:MAG: hypothetical protein K2I81_01730 [Alphaproteobacteria bacterium]|nr:hypothetical protein [Alphaproteobacteria bacterium]
MKFRFANISKETWAVLLAFGVVVGIDRGCSSHRDVDTTEIDKEIMAARTSLDSLIVLHNAEAAKHEMYKHKCDSLCPRVGDIETPSERERKNRQWRQWRDSVSKYGDRAIDLQIERDWARLRVDTLMSKRERMKLR